MLVKFLNSGDKVSTAIAGSYFKGDGWTGAYYDSAEGRLVFESEDGLGFTTGDLRVATGGASSVEWTTVLNKPTSFPPSAHTHLWADITDKPTEFTPVSHNHTISTISGLQAALDGKQPTTSFKTINGTVITGTGDITIAGAVTPSLSASQVFPDLAGKVMGLAIPYAQLSSGGETWFADIAARGTPIVRLDAYWDQIQTTNGGNYNWNSLDTVVDGLIAQGVQVLLVPSNKPAWGSSALVDPADRQNFADFCGELAAHFITRCDNFEVVNEPNKTAINAVNYADALKRAYVAIKQKNPSAIVISGGLSPVMVNGANETRLPEWVDDFFNVPGIGQYFDQFGMHPYTLPYWLSDPEVANSTAENGWSWMVELIRPRMVTEGIGHKPIAITEMGFVSAGDLAYDNGAGLPAGQAEAMQEAITAALALPWVSSFFLYSYRDLDGITNEGSFGITYTNGTDKPVAATFAEAVGSYVGAVVVASVSEEEVQDWVGNLITQGTGISVNYDDVGNVLSIELSGVSFTSADKSKLDGIAENATANSTDSQLRERSTHTGTQAISTISGLQAALTTATDTLVTLQSEIAEARAQLSAVSAFAAPNAGGIVPGRYYDNATTSVANSNYTSAVDRVDMTPFITSRPLRVDQLGFAVATAGSAAYGRAFVYECGADGWPSDLIFEGTDDMDLNSANFRGHTLASPITFEANRVYWVGWRFGAATTYAVMRGLNISSAPNLGLAASSSNNYLSVLRRTIPFATRLPATWGFVESELTASVPPSIRMRATA